MSLPLIPRWCICVAAMGLCIPGTATESGSDQAGVWKKVASYLSKEAVIELKELPTPENPETQRERDFCTAVVTLDQQPLSEARLDDVEARLQALLAANGDDATANASRYLLGRMAQLYREQPRIEEAAAYYREALRYQESGEWAKQARVRLAVLELYVLPTGSRRDRLEAVRGLIDEAKDPIVIRDLHRLAARGVMFFNLPPEWALEHLLKADEIGGLEGILGADQLVQIGELAMDTRQPELSARFYERLRHEYPRDARVYINDRRQAGASVPTRREELNGR